MKKIISSVLIMGLLMMSGYIYFEPEIIKANADSVVVTQAVSEEITISSPADVTMSSAIPGMTGNPGAPKNASTTWTVKTNNAQGFNMTINSTSTPSMQLDATWNFSDYSPATANVPDYAWSPPAANVAEFGYSVEPATAADTVALFRDNGSACNTGTLNTADRCWLNASTTAVTVINRTTNTAAAGEAEVVKFQTESNAKYLKEGNYTATITATATMN